MSAGEREIAADVLVVGGGCGGCAAALALARAGVRCVVTEPTVMLGGQLSSQGVPPDENPWIDGGGPGAPRAFRAGNASYLSFRERVRSWYRAQGALTAAAMSDEALNPGGGWVSRLCFEPRIAGVVLAAMLSEADAGRGLLRVLHGVEPTGAEVEGDHVRAVSFGGPAGEVTVRAVLVLDATELGDVLALAGVEHAVGAESASVFGEMHGRTDLGAGVRLDELDQQACTWCFAIDHEPGRDAGEGDGAPAMYDRWRSYVPEMRPAWTGRLFSWTVPSHNDAGRTVLRMIPPPDAPPEGERELWRYRRVVDASRHTDGRSDVSLMNVVQMDFWGEPLIGGGAEGRRRAEACAREQALCVLHWMRTEAPRHDGGEGYPGLGLRGDVLGSDDGFALAPYVREPRRLGAMTVVSEAHVGAEQRLSSGVRAIEGVGAPLGERFVDTVAIGHYPIDLHPSCAGRNSVYVPACPFRVPFAALVPVRVRNVLASGKCLGVSHVANGCTRLHPVEWAVGEAAGTAAAMCVGGRIEPRALAEDPARVRELQGRLSAAGAPLAWPWESER